MYLREIVRHNEIKSRLRLRHLARAEAKDVENPDVAGTNEQ